MSGIRVSQVQRRENKIIFIIIVYIAFGDYGLEDRVTHTVHDGIYLDIDDEAFHGSEWRVNCQMKLQPFQQQ